VEDVRLIRAHAAAIHLAAPLVVVRFDARSERNTAASIEGLKSQLLETWRAELHFDSTCSSRTVALAQAYAREDHRLLVNADAAQTAAPAGRGVVTSALFLRGSVLLREHALYMFALAAANHENVVVYSDEDRLNEQGERLAPHFKPVFSPELFENQNYLGNCVLVRGGSEVLTVAMSDFVSKYRDVGPMVDNVVQSLDSRNIVHVPHVLYHDTLETRPRGPLRVGRSPDDPLPSVSIIVPTKDRVDLLRPCIESIRSKTEYPKDKFEIVVIDNGSQETETIQFLAMSASCNAIRLVKEPGSFNFSRINNRAAAQCRNDILVFLNNDTTVIDPFWLQRLVSFARRTDVGAVGAKLLYPDGTVQHGGVVVGIHNSAVHNHVGIRHDDPGAQGLANLTREVAAVTGACMAIRRALFEKLGGFDEELAISFNDTDLCLRALAGGYRNIYVSAALFTHFESKTRGLDNTPEKLATARREAEITRTRYARFFRCDPYYNPNLSAERLYELAFPPRRTKPWRDYARRSGRLRVLLLSLTHGSSHRVSRITDMQARDLISAGHEVFVGGPKSDAEPEYGGCRRVAIGTWDEAAGFAVQEGMDCVVAHEWPFFSVARWTGEWPRVICVDHRELPLEIFDNERERMEMEKRMAFSTAHCVISARAEDESAASSTQMVKCLEDIKTAIEVLCLTPGGRLPVASAGQNSLFEPQGGHVGDLSGARDSRLARHSNLRSADRRGFYAALRGLNGSELVDRAYLAILGRYADQSGRQHYIDELSRGASKDGIVWEIANSSESRARGVCASDVMSAAGLTHRKGVGTARKKGILSSVLAKVWHST
jgi:GT2 family glycosyltransferase